MADIAISILYVIPDKTPGGMLGSMRLTCQTTNDLDMRSKDDFGMRIGLSDIRNES